MELYNCMEENTSHYSSNEDNDMCEIPIEKIQEM